MKRGVLSALVVTCFLIATGCTISLGHTPEASGVPSTNNQPIPTPSPSPLVTGVPGATGRIAAVDASGTLTVFGADGSDAVVLADSVPGETLVRQPTWSRNGERIAWAQLNAGGTSAEVMTAAADGTRPTDTSVAAAPFYLSWDPTSSRIVYLGGSASAAVSACNTSGGRAKS